MGLILISTLSAPVLADQPIDETRPLNADARVSVSNCAGTIHVQAWDKNSLSLTGQLGDGVEKLLIEGDASKLRIEVKLPKNAHNVEDTVLQLRVPAGVALDLESVSADLAVQGMRGALKANSVSGDVHLQIDAPKVVAQTVSGDLHVEGASRDTQLKSVSGDVFVRGSQGELVGETVSGNLSVDGTSLAKLWLKSVSGDFNVKTSLTDAARANLETLSGEVDLALPASTNAAVDLTTFSGDLDSDLGSIPSDTHKASLKLGNGNGIVSVHSFSGDISLKKK
jgi:DUF4097 and DUF4098 domain-containing protein YvlB